MLFAAKINSNEILKIRSSKKYSLTISNISLDLDSEVTYLFYLACIVVFKSIGTDGLSC